ncbi:MAG: hypothetical protein ACE5LU_25555, partial [Anaerolineae bacterium]
AAIVFGETSAGVRVPTLVDANGNVLMNIGDISPTDTTLQNAATANGNGTALSVNGKATAALQVTGTFSATVNFEGTEDDTNWVAIQGTNLTDGGRVTTTTATGLFVFNVAGLSQLRARISGYASGSVTVTGKAIGMGGGTGGGGGGQVQTEATWTTLVNAVRLDDSPTSYNSANMDVDGYRGAWVLIDVDSTLTPTDVRFLAQFSDDGGTTYWDYEEGLWASLYFEDQDTASGVKKVFDLPLEGIDDWRIRVVATGTNATNYFDVTVKARGYR